MKRSPERNYNLRFKSDYELIAAAKVAILVAMEVERALDFPQTVTMKSIMVSLTFIGVISKTPVLVYKLHDYGKMVSNAIDST